MKWLRSMLVLGASCLGACTGSVTFRSPIDYAVVLDAYTSAFLAQGFGGTSPIACTQPGGDAQCQAGITPGIPGEDLLVRCNAQNVCDPDPYPFVLDLGVQDLEAVAAPQLAVVDEIRIQRIELLLRTNTTNVDVPPFQLRWGSESASVGTVATTTQPLAEVPAVAMGQTGAVPVTVDDAGLTALDAYLRTTSTRVRFFLVTVLDVQPTLALPAGALDLQLALIVRASGKLH